MPEVKLASRMTLLNESATLSLNARAKQMAAEGKTIYNLTAGELATDTPEYIQKSVANFLDKNKYSPVAGLPELRSAIAEHARKFYGLEWIKSENVVVTGGAKPALHTAFLALINPGDEVILPVPAWVSYIDLIELAGGVVVKPKLADGYDLDIDAIKATITQKTKLILINSPHNPTGAIFSKESITKLAKLLKGTDIAMLSDDIYSKLIFNSNFTPVPSVGFKKVVIINGFSKSQALTGWRIGYLIADKPISDAVTALLSHITGNAALPSQYAALQALKRNDQPPASTLLDLRAKQKLVIKKLSAVNGLKHNIPAGAFYTFLDIRELTKNSAKWCELLLQETGVVLVPGEAFEAPGFARLTFSGDELELKKALEQIKIFVEGDRNK